MTNFFFPAKGSIQISLNLFIKLNLRKFLLFFSSSLRFQCLFFERKNDLSFVFGRKRRWWWLDIDVLDRVISWFLDLCLPCSNWYGFEYYYIILCLYVSNCRVESLNIETLITTWSNSFFFFSSILMFGGKEKGYIFH